MIRALIVTNMYPTPRRPELGSFVADQVAALRATGEAEVEVFAFAPGGATAYPAAARSLRRGRRHRHGHRPGHRHGHGHGHGTTGFDVVHAHFGLTAWPARAVRAEVHAVTLHGTDVVHPRSRAITLAALPLQDIVGVVSQPLAERVPRWATRGRPPAVLPCGVDLHRFLPIARAHARRRLGLDPAGRYLLFGADPARPAKRADRARALAEASGATLLTLGAVPPAEVPYHVNAADAVLVTSERESFGLVGLEALACDVPVLSTPVGVAPQALAGLPGTLCAPFELTAWHDALAPHLSTADPRLTGGRARAQRWSADAMALRVLAAWRAALHRRDRRDR